MKQIWVSYNGMPGGNICVRHFEDVVRQRKQGDQNVDVKFKAEELLEGFKKEPGVKVNIKGKITNNEVLIYKGDSLEGDPQAADKVIAWAIAQGMEPIRASQDQKGDQPKTYEFDKRITSLEGDVSDIKGDINKILDLLTKTTAPSSV